LYVELVSYWPELVSQFETEVPPFGRIDPPLTDPVDRMMFFDQISYLPNDILTKVDRASMAVSLEAREPLLDYRLVEFAWTLPHAMKVQHGVGKPILRRVLRRYVPDALIERPKKGFSLPLSAWLRGPLRSWAESLLDPVELARSGLFDPGPVRAKWREHLACTHEWHYEIWAILMLQAWLREPGAVRASAA
jgi:asparagine synthase (glutamine-hydrolysing)